MPTILLLISEGFDLHHEGWWWPMHPLQSQIESEEEMTFP